MKVYKSLYSRYKDQPNSEIFSYFLFNSNSGENWETPFERLAKMAKPEKWNFSSPQFKKDGINYPILWNYLNYTFLRCQELNLITYSKDNKRSCFNTGLQTINEKDIYATFYRTPDSESKGQTDWTLFCFADSYSDKLKDFQPLPEIATYINEASDLVFDTKLDIEVNYEHIFDNNQERLPEVLKGNRVLAISSIKGSVELLKEKILRNYKIAIPHWYEGKIQLLLPLNITSDSVADLALVAYKDKDRNIYKIKTVLSMDMAYIDARLITRPDSEWLNP